MKRLFLVISLIVSCQGVCFAQFNKPRYISLAPSTTEILFALGLDEEIAGVSSYCNYPLRVKAKQKVGTFSLPNIEQILALKPDYIFCTGLEQVPVIEQLRQLKLKVYVADPSNVEGLLTSITDIGKITGRQKEAEGLVGSMRSQIEKIKSKAALIPPQERPKVFIEIWDDPLTTAGKGSFVDDLLTLAGGVNIAGDTQRAFSIFSPEEVIRRNPDCIILAYMNKQDPLKVLSARFGWEGISAVKNNRVYSDINPDLLLRPGPRVVIGLRQIYERLHR
jgi:iron complex transport system substrate-binding protein